MCRERKGLGVGVGVGGLRSESGISVGQIWEATQSKISTAVRSSKGKPLLDILTVRKEIAISLAISEAFLPF